MARGKGRGAVWAHPVEDLPSERGEKIDVLWLSLLGSTGQKGGKTSKSGFLGFVKGGWGARRLLGGSLYLGKRVGTGPISSHEGRKERTKEKGCHSCHLGKVLLLKGEKMARYQGRVVLNGMTFSVLLEGRPAL